MNGDHSLPADFRGIIEECAHRAMDDDVEGTPDRERFRVVSDDLGIFLYILARATKRKSVVELDGVHGAASSIVWLSGAMKETGGTVTTWELNPRRLVKLQNSLSRARLAPYVNIGTIDPLFATDDEGGVIAPPVADENDSPTCCDMVIVSLTEDDWPRRIEYGWELLQDNGLLILTDTLQVGSYAENILGDFFGTRFAATVGITLTEGVLVALKMDESTGRNEVPDIAMVGKKAHEVLKELERQNSQPGSRLWAIPPITGKFLWILLRAMNAKDVLEVGASSGYSGIWMATALIESDGQLATMDFDPEKVVMASENYKRAGVDDLVSIQEGDALEIVPTIDQQFDLIFLDCDKQFYYDLIDPILYRVKRGGLLIADNVISHKDDLGSYLDEIKNHSCLMSVTLPIGSGEEMTMVL